MLVPQADAESNKTLREQEDGSPLGVTVTLSWESGRTSGRKPRIWGRELFSTVKPPCLKKAPHTGLLTAVCIFEFESQMLWSGSSEGEILSLTTVATAEPG